MPGTRIDETRRWPAAGHSLGEYAALHAAGALAFDDALLLVDERAAAMQEAAEARPGGMVAMLGGDPHPVMELARGLGLTVANDNAPGQVVLSGAIEMVDTAAELARGDAGARAMKLDVAGAFHSPLMEPQPSGCAPRSPRRRSTSRVPVWSNGSAAPFADVRRELSENLLKPVRWRETLLALRAHGAERFVELGPGAVLTGMVKRTLAVDGPKGGGMKAGLFGVGTALPEHRLGNDHFTARLDTTDEWIVRRTGIRERYHLNGRQTLADLAVDACEAALADAGRDGHEVDHVIVSTITPDRITPGLAPEVAMRSARAGPARWTSTPPAPASSTPSTRRPRSWSPGARDVVLVVGAEALSRLTDGGDRCTAVSSATAPALSSWQAASSSAAAAPSSFTPTEPTGTCSMPGATSACCGWRAARSTATRSPVWSRRRRPPSTAPGSPSTTSTCSSPTRPTPASSRRPPPSSGSRTRRSR